MYLRSGEQAWLVMEWLKGRAQTEIARDLGMQVATVCNSIKRFCDRWSGVDVSRQMMYGDERKQAALHALKSFHFDGDSDLIQKPVVAPPLTFSEEDYNWAQYEHAWLLRAEGLTFREIGWRLNRSEDRARQMVWKFGRRCSKAMRRVRWDRKLTRPARRTSTADR